VTPVIVVWADFAQLVGQTGAGSFVSGLSGGGSRIRLARIAAGRVEQIAQAVANALAGLDVTRRLVAVSSPLELKITGRGQDSGRWPS
jgi:hypothetical protein